MNPFNPVEVKLQQTHLETGRAGEEIAKDYLERKGYKIIEQNYKTKYAEIDLVAKKENEMVFIEVRTKKGEDFGTPEETIDKKKMRKLWGNARAYTAWKKWQGPYRVDAVCIVLKPSGEVDRLNHYENII
ncbi:MAG: YraN family protein [bacterium]|nr:YraN family protein [bacterium]